MKVIDENHLILTTAKEVDHLPHKYNYVTATYLRSSWHLLLHDISPDGLKLSAMESKPLDL